VSEDWSRRVGIRTAGVALVATLLATSLALAATPQAGARYSGQTGQGKAISFRVSTTGARITHPRLSLVTKCVGGGKSFAALSAHNTKTATGPISSGGKFVLHARETARFQSGEKALARFTISGHFSPGRHAAGKAMVIVTYSGGQECSAVGVPFQVKG
jgi:hypothetical protein